MTRKGRRLNDKQKAQSMADLIGGFLSFPDNSVPEPGIVHRRGIPVKVKPKTGDYGFTQKVTVAGKMQS